MIELIIIGVVIICPIIGILATKLCNWSWKQDYDRERYGQTF